MLSFHVFTIQTKDNKPAANEVSPNYVRTSLVRRPERQCKNDYVKMISTKRECRPLCRSFTYDNKHQFFSS
jgi:hypothetical protein